MVVIKCGYTRGDKKKRKRETRKTLVIKLKIPPTI